MSGHECSTADMERWSGDVFGCIRCKKGKFVGNVFRFPSAAGEYPHTEPVDFLVLLDLDGSLFIQFLILFYGTGQDGICGDIGSPSWTIPFARAIKAALEAA